MSGILVVFESCILCKDGGRVHVWTGFCQKKQTFQGKLSYLVPYIFIHIITPFLSPSLSAGREPWLAVVIVSKKLTILTLCQRHREGSSSLCTYVSNQCIQLSTVPSSPDEFFLRLGLWDDENFIINLSLPKLPYNICKHLHLLWLQLSMKSNEIPAVYIPSEYFSTLHYNYTQYKLKITFANICICYDCNYQ